MEAAGHTTKTKQVQLAILLNVIGEEAVEVFNTFDLTVEEQKDYGKVLGAFENYAKPRKNVVVERYIFNSRCQAEGETFDMFLIELKK
ncbi:hypothetical protein JTE90_006744 [Oedothorax gibbosus]|uniref:Uncharacterized protein n=1 Tax=Oedothorax gibbosus TaxID=931172 RepID=A0AAV6UJF1_9ARAC|nr:hypothetical protein JTE90_006744 [Oedothorax gibbosus]